jgi:hypothetical protein
VIPLYGIQASRSYNPTFSASLKDPSVALVTGLAHGAADVFTGFNHEPLFNTTVGIDDDEVGHKIVHFFSCSTAIELGPLIASKCKAFIGYSRDIVYTPAWYDAFVRCDAAIDLALANGAKVWEAIGAAQAAFISEIAVAPPDLAQELQNMSQSLGFFGNAMASLASLS